MRSRSSAAALALLAILAAPLAAAAEGSLEPVERRIAGASSERAEAAKSAYVALGFESGCCREGVDRAVVERRSSVT
jgi:hypothetical protein